MVEGFFMVKPMVLPYPSLSSRSLSLASLASSSLPSTSAAPGQTHRILLVIYLINYSMSHKYTYRLYLLYHISKYIIYHHIISYIYIYHINELVS